MFETVILLTATGILAVEFIEWQHKREQYGDTAPNEMSSDWAMPFVPEGHRGRVATVEGRR